MKKKINLTSKIFIALILGSIIGVTINLLDLQNNNFVNNYIINGLLYLFGTGFIKLLKMLVIPLVFTSLVCGTMAIGDTKKLGKIGGRTMLFYLFTTALAITIALLIGSLINPGVGLDLNSIHASESVKVVKKTNLFDTLLNILPDNIFNSFSKGSMLPIIFFALLLGIILAKLNDSVELVSNFFSQANDIMMEMTLFVMKLSPIGVFCLITKTFSVIGFDAFIPMLKYMGAVFLALAVQAFVVYLSLLKVFTGLSPIKFLKNFFPVMAFAFSTSSSNSTIPLTINNLKNEVGVSKKISSFTIPLGATINMDGTAIMQGVAVVFAAGAFNIHLSTLDYITVISTATLASIGTAGIPSVGLITLTMVFNSVGLPIEAIALIMGIDRILDMTRTAVNVTGDAICTTIIAKKNNALDIDVFNSD